MYQWYCVDGVEQKAARYPNSGYLSVKDSPDNKQFSLKNFNLSKDDIVGAVAHIRMSQWRLASRRIADYKDDYIYLTEEAKSDYSKITPQFLVFFTQVLGAIDSNNEWAYNNGKIYMKSDDTPQNVTAVCSEHGIYLDADAKRVTIKGLNITKINGNVIDKKSGTRKSANDTLIIENNNISHVAGWGIKIEDFYKRIRAPTCKDAD